METDWLTFYRAMYDGLGAIIDAVKPLENQRERLWQKYPGDEEVQAVVKLVERCGYKVQSTRKLQYGCVGLVLTSDTMPKQRRYWGMVRRKLTARAPLDAWWGTTYVPVEENENYANGGGGYVRGEIWLYVRLRRSAPTAALVELIGDL